MDESDLIVVDDDGQAGPSSARGSTDVSSFYAAKERRSSTAERPVGTSSRPLRSTAVTDRTTRSANAKPRVQPKLKLKLSEKAVSQAPGMSFLGPYDRELDSDDEDLTFEEQFILRLPPGEDCEKLRKMVAAREISNDVWFKFKDSRRAVFHIGNNSYSSKLVDLPCIIESQKTLDNKQMFKVADICQMLVVEDKLHNEDQIAQHKSFNIDEFIWPHGITPPLHHVRKRRFRKRVNRRTIESVEQAVERLLEEDSAATEIKYEILENVNPDLSDSEFVDKEEALDSPIPMAGSDTGEARTPGGDIEEGEGDGDGEEDEGAEGDIDEELAAELDLALGDDDGDDVDEDEEDDEDESDDEDEDDEDEDAQARKLLNEEIRDLEAAVAKKGREVASSNNPLIRKRFEDALKKLSADLEMKLAQRDEMKEQQRMRKEGIPMEEADTDPEAPAIDDEDAEGEGDKDPETDGLFGGDDPLAMDDS